MAVVNGNLKIGDKYYVKAEKPVNYGLPSGYTGLTYIKSSGTQYIDTGIAPSTNTKIEMSFMPTSLSNDMFFLGCNDNTSTRFDAYYYPTSSSSLLHIRCYDGTSQNLNYSIVTNTKYNLSMYSNGSTSFANLNGSELSYNIQFTPVSNSLYICNANNNGVLRGGSSIKLYSFKIYNGTTLVQDLYPCKRNSDNAIGMYDKVTNTFFGNSGTGTFIAGETTETLYDNPSTISNGTTKSVAVPQGKLTHANVNVVGGKSSKVNQRVDGTKINTSSKHLTVINNNGKLTINGTTTTKSAYTILYSSNTGFILNHKILILGATGSSASSYYVTISGVGNADKIENFIYTVVSTTYDLRLDFVANQVFNNFKFRPRYADLTDIFGSGNEPSSLSDSRIIWLKDYLDSHPEYNAGTVIHADVEDIESKDSSNTTIQTLTIPQAIRNLEGYGQAYDTSVNTLNLANKTFTAYGKYVDTTWTPYATPQVTDISALLPSNIIQTQSNGTLTFNNANNLDVPTTMKYWNKYDG